MTDDTRIEAPLLDQPQQCSRGFTDSYHYAPTADANFRLAAAALA